MFPVVRLLTAMILTGYASQYAPGVMEATVAARQAGLTARDLPADLPEVDGFVAVEDCDLVGEIVWVRKEGRNWEKFLIADCSGHVETTEWMLRNGILVEVGYGTAQRWDVVGKGGVKIELSFTQPGGFNEDKILEDEGMALGEILGREPLDQSNSRPCGLLTPDCSRVDEKAERASAEQIEGRIVSIRDWQDKYRMDRRAKNRHVHPDEGKNVRPRTPEGCYRAHDRRNEPELDRRQARMDLCSLRGQLQ